MTQMQKSATLPDLGSAGDPDLIALVRGGDSAAYEELFVRHRDVALRLARRLTDPERADDLCSEAFAKILSLLRRGKGPDVAFRAYLLTTVRTLHINAIRDGHRERTVADDDLQALVVPVSDDVDARFDEGAIARAFKQLPERWQSALWMTAVEGLPNEEVSRHLGIHTNAVASLAFRARAGLRQAYLAEHLSESAGTECSRIVDLLPSFLRGTLTPRRRDAVQAHLDRCSRCSVAASELADVDRRLGALIGPALLGTAAAALWPATAGAPAAPAVAGVLAGVGHGGIASFFGSPAGSLSIAKIALVAAVGAGSLAVTAHQLGHLGPDRPVTAATEMVSTRTPEPTGIPGLPRTIGQKADASPSVPTAPTAPAGLRSEHPPVPTPSEPTANRPVRPAAHSPLAPVASPAAPASTKPTSAPASPSTPPPADPPTSAPTNAARAIAVGTLRNQTFQRYLMTWNRVTVPVTNPVKGTTLRLTTTRTYAATLVRAPASGWSCTTPALNWLVQFEANSTTTCMYDGTGDGSPLQVEYDVDRNARLRVLLTPPAGFLDTSALDNVADLDLID